MFVIERLRFGGSPDYYENPIVTRNATLKLQCSKITKTLQDLKILDSKNCYLNESNIDCNIATLLLQFSSYRSFEHTNYN